MVGWGLGSDGGNLATSACCGAASCGSSKARCECAAIRFVTCDELTAIGNSDTPVLAPVQKKAGGCSYAGR